ncbi:hypothetical protein STCU_10852 [Strigomonas culicis]|uniref:Uncharacterized protein n=1 Tax=Strigomonas culicis TaxID=28005 RepID=S9UR03_9TRYP|nr:hypothetical protein STCU_10852 [Strigomonas culicis]|eukprot:EPY17036.1 hypothetical protein STCU_10852 [Strigomonas culicis]
MEELLSVYTGGATPSPRSPVKTKKQQQQTTSPSATKEGSSRRNTSQPANRGESLSHEDLENMRQFEEYSRCVVSASGRMHNSRQSNVSLRHGISPRSGAPASVGGCSVTSFSPSVMKIQSSCISQGRLPTQTELLLMSEIEERDSHRWEVIDRAHQMRETQEVMVVEECLDKERKVANRIRNKAVRTESMQEQKFEERTQRQELAEQRRKEMERERQEKLEKEVAEKEERRKAVDSKTYRTSAPSSSIRRSVSNRNSAVRQSPSKHAE